MTHRVYVDGPIHEEALGMLRSATEVVSGAEAGSPEIASALPDAHAVLLRTASLGAEAIAGARSLRVIARHGVGVDNVAVEEAARRGIPVLITPRANLRSVAEHVFALMLAVCRNLIRSDRAVREGRFASRDRLPGRELFGATLGVIGLGRVGWEVARMATEGFGMRVLGYDPHLPPERIREGGAEAAKTLPDLLGACDLLTVHVPLSEATRGLLGRRELALMGPGSILIQTSRGGVVDEAALVEALSSGRLAGAGIDVYETEPPPQDHPFFSMEQVVLTPHTAALTDQAMRRMAVDAAQGILDVLGGADPYDPPEGARWQAFGPRPEEPEE
ncbi:MAG TPA: hydroxyacid dehydrogenase [Rubrobacteraceae bacterium]|nr:hydroxyacid dehydrogenase [Rubrobacteraceae bacterium]